MDDAPGGSLCDRVSAVNLGAPAHSHAWLIHEASDQCHLVSLLSLRTITPNHRIPAMRGVRLTLLAIKEKVIDLIPLSGWRWNRHSIGQSGEVHTRCRSTRLVIATI